MRLTHQDVALFGLKPRATGRFFPPDIDVAGHDAGPAGPARSGGTFEGQIDALPEAGMQDQFLVAAIEGQFAALALDRYLHRGLWPPLLEKVVVHVVPSLKIVGQLTFDIGEDCAVFLLGLVGL